LKENSEYPEKSQTTPNLLAKKIKRENPTWGSRRIAKQVKEVFPYIDVESFAAGFRIKERNKKNLENESTFSELIKSNNLDSSNMNWSEAWLKNKDVSLKIKNTSFSQTVDYETMREDFIEEMKAFSPKFKKIVRQPNDSDSILVLDIADLHIGKLAEESSTGEDYNESIAFNRAVEGVSGILTKAERFGISSILFVIGNDILHTDNSVGTTTKGTKQDTSGSWYSNFLLARKLYVGIITSLMQEYDVHVIHCPSNHDFVSGLMLADSVSSWFHNSENVTFDISPRHRKYFQYGNNLIGLSHGDGAKLSDLPILMANEAKREWADTYFRYIYLHHVHHKEVNQFKSGKDYQGVTVEYLRSPSAADYWHDMNGYNHAFKAVEGRIHHKQHGQVAQISHLFEI